ncbi:nucleoside recognition domain-containing protein [Lacibacter sediminis]|uniref:Spore maturation protein n=1 Tax=Lacibacter sediminis TaxID=2760713 RepID=A0A7G5XBZ0_9BACT|nr:spore maturation protein [Lacibacter sediminis]QNA42993.1 spore maturation protein [Lacibacter sediminis]
MALSRIWSAFILIAITVALFKYLPMGGEKQIFSSMIIGKNGDSLEVKSMNSTSASPAILQALDTSSRVTENKITYKREGSEVVAVRVQNANGVIETCKDAVTICIGLIGIMALFMGFMSIAEKAGGINLLSRIIGPFFSRIFPEVPKGHPAFGHMMMNFSANLLNLDNAATPFGLKAMESLQELNPSKTTASNAQLMFLCLHASGLTLIPVTIIAARASLKASNPTDIFVPCMVATFAATMAAMFIVSFKQKINVFQPVILAWVLGISAIIASLVLYLVRLDADGVQSFSSVLSNGLILFIFLAIVLGALYKKINVFDAFIEGAKGGFETAVRIIPYLVGMLVAISLLRTSGTFDVVINGMKSIFMWMGADTRFVDGLPTALIKPLSGSGARGMMIDTMKTFGPDSFAGRLSSVLQGSSDTTFYVIAVYFGAVGIKNTRYAVGAMLLADLVGIITSILLAYLFFGSSL